MQSTLDMSQSDPVDAARAQDRIGDSLQDVCTELAKRMHPSKFERYYGENERVKRAKMGDRNPLNYLLELALSPSFQQIMKRGQKGRHVSDGEQTSQYHSLLETDAHVQKAFQTFAGDFPTAIWTCCAGRCFSLTAILPENSALFNAVLNIHKGAEAIHDQIEDLSALVRSRRRTSGRSSLVHTNKSKSSTKVRSATDRQNLRQELRVYVTQCIPYLRAECLAPDGTASPSRPFCTEAICQILGIQRNFLYRPTDNEACIIDVSGVRQRKFRRIGSRKGFVEISELSNFRCGCDIPCFYGLKQDVLQRLWDGFKDISTELSPEQKEHRYLMNQMFCPLTNTSVRVCNKAIAQLYTISEALVASVRLLVHQMCDDPALQDLPLREHGMKRYRERHHPMNRFPPDVIEHIERHLDMILRPDPAASDGTNICRVYSPEVNTQEKLRKLIARNMKVDFEDVVISPTSLQRMIKSYLDKRGCRISFNQSDHNACPSCKSHYWEILFLHHEKKQLYKRLSIFEQLPRPLTEEQQNHYDDVAVPLQQELALKTFRDEEVTSELKRHNERDARIRGWLKRLTDHLRCEENDARRTTLKTGLSEPFAWCQRRNRALVTHQDDMTKVDLPHVVVDASADITRWRFDVNAHVNAITGNCTVFSHEQGAASKTSSSILELTLLDHILTCAGESIKVVISDNASVGKNWLSTVAFPQYLVDQGLADIVMIAFLENNHGKWLADMLFGQFQIRKRNTTVLGIDALLQEFEGVNRPSGGRIQGYAVNPLGSVDLAQVFEGLGYDTKPPKEFGFKNRNIHFACACRPGAKEKLTPKLKELFANALPSEAGMVRLSSEPPNYRPNAWRSFEDRWVDVPVATKVLASNPPGNDSTDEHVPLSVPLDQAFAAHGPGLASKRTAQHVGFNGFAFRKKMSFPELEDRSYDLTEEAWPPGLLHIGEPGYELESLRCAPENWLLRRPVRYHGKARYPPMNMLNTLFLHGPRAKFVSVGSDEPVHWVHTATYSEPPFPIEKRLSASEAMRSVATEHDDISKGVHLLHVLRAIYDRMGNRKSVSDKWLQNPATYAAPASVAKFKELLNILQKRDGARPKPALTLWQAFKEDPSVKAEVEGETDQEFQVQMRTREEFVSNLFETTMARESPETLSRLQENMDTYNTALQKFSNEKKTKRAATRHMLNQQKQIQRNRVKIMTRLFEKWKLKPGALDRFHRCVEQDKQRYARELKVFKEEVADKFDSENELLPVQGPLAQH